MRTQFKNYKDPTTGKVVERKLLDYQTHLNRICPLLAINFAIVFGAQFMMTSYDQMMNLVQQKEDFSMLAPMHTILSGFKALWCNLCYEGVKTLRECCGGVGFHAYSNFPSMLDALSSKVTLEGDSVVMYLQAARSLLKGGRKVITSGKSLNKMIEYIGDLKILMEQKDNFKCLAKSMDDFRDEKFLLDLLKWNALLRIGKCLQLFADPKYKDFSLWEKFNEKFQLDLIKMAQAHSYYMTALYFLNGIDHAEKEGTCKNLIKHMRVLFKIFCLHSVTNQGAALALSQYLSPEQFRMAHELLQEQYKVIRPQILNLIESFEYDDSIMSSAIGNYDGNVYE